MILKSAKISGITSDPFNIVMPQQKEVNVERSNVKILAYRDVDERIKFNDILKSLAYPSTYVNLVGEDYDNIYLLMNIHSEGDDIQFKSFSSNETYIKQSLSVKDKYTLTDNTQDVSILEGHDLMLDTFVHYHNSTPLNIINDVVDTLVDDILIGYTTDDKNFKYIYLKTLKYLFSLFSCKIHGNPILNIDIISNNPIAENEPNHDIMIRTESSEVNLRAIYQINDKIGKIITMCMFIADSMLTKRTLFIPNILETMTEYEFNKLVSAYNSANSNQLNSQLIVTSEYVDSEYLKQYYNWSNYYA